MFIITHHEEMYIYQQTIIVAVGWAARMSCSQPDAWLKLKSKGCEQVTALLAVLYNHY